MNPNLPVGDQTIRVHAQGKLITPPLVASIGAPRLKVERAGDANPKPSKPAALKVPPQPKPQPHAPEPQA